jgi:dihydroxyacetone kinase-like protein
MEMVETSVSSEVVLRWLDRCARTFQEHKDELTKLDAAIGDADHGANMARGFTAVQGKLASVSRTDLGEIFKMVAMTLISTVGGASGPLYGSFFLQASLKTAGKMNLSPEEIYTTFQAGLQGVANRGKAVVGDKTMIDAFAPAVAALEPHGADTAALALDRAVIAARQGANSTIPLVAKKGRASYLGERSAGHQDPGSLSTVFLFEALRDALQTPP